MDHTPLITARGLTRRWGSGDTAQLGIDDVDVTIGRGELVAVTGPSGSGKSTLGALIAGIDQPTSGSLVVDGRRIDRLRNAELARWRAAHVGIVFQDFHLLPTLTATENVELALEFAPQPAGRRERRRRAQEALGEVGLARKSRRLPSELSGGEQQRVAIARAMVTQPALVVADEPTGSLDQATSEQVVELLAARTLGGATVVMITHDDSIAGRADRHIAMLDGRLDAHAAAGIDLLPHRGTRPVGPAWSAAPPARAHPALGSMSSNTRARPALGSMSRGVR